MEISFRVNSIELNRIKWTKEYRVEREIVKFKIDAGAEGNCIPLGVIRKLKM